MYDLITVNAGHSDVSTGASGNGYKEHEVARMIKNRILDKFKLVGQACVDTTSDAKTSSEVLREQVAKCDYYTGKVKRQLNISIHLNAGGGTGTEVLYKNQRELAVYVSREISKAMGWRDRGAKQRNDLYFLNGCDAPSILIEVCFIDSKDDMDKLMSKMYKVVDAIVKTTSGKIHVPKEEQEKETYYQVVAGSFLDRDNADRKVKELSAKGIESFVQIK